MNDEIKNALLKLITQAGNTITEQAPDILKQYVTFGIIDNAVGLAFCICCLAATLIIARRLIKTANAPDYSGSLDVPIIKFIAGGVIFIIAFLTFCTIEDLLKIEFAPKAYLLHELIK